MAYKSKPGFNRLSHRPGITLIATCILFTAAPAISSAQTLPVPSRSICKCSANGVMSYSDAPCLGAERLEIEPTRGVGRKEGRDVQQERHREMFAEAVRPLTGLNAKQLDVQGRRIKLLPDIQRECRALDAQIPSAERDEGKATGERLNLIRGGLFILRQRQRDLRC